MRFTKEASSGYIVLTAVKIKRGGGKMYQVYYFIENDVTGEMFREDLSNEKELNEFLENMQGTIEIFSIEVL